jgi:hypothetical protein
MRKLISGFVFVFSVVLFAGLMLSLTKTAPRHPLLNDDAATALAIGYTMAK